MSSTFLDARLNWCSHNPLTHSALHITVRCIYCVGSHRSLYTCLNPLTSNDYYSGRTAPLTSKRCILYIYSTNIGTEYFKHGIYSSFFSLQNEVCFIILTYLVPVLFTFYIQDAVKLKNNSGAKRLIHYGFRSVWHASVHLTRHYKPSGFD